MKRIYTKAQLESKKNKRAKRQAKKEKTIHPNTGNKIYTLHLVSPMQCLDGVNEVLNSKKVTVTKFGDTHMIVQKLDKKEYEELATEIRKCRVKTPRGRVFKVIVYGTKFTDVTPKEETKKKASNKKKVVKIANKYAKKQVSARTISLMDLIERRMKKVAQEGKS